MHKIYMTGDWKREIDVVFASHQLTTFFLNKRSAKWFSDQRIDIAQLLIIFMIYSRRGI